MSKTMKVVVPLVLSALLFLPIFRSWRSNSRREETLRRLATQLFAAAPEAREDAKRKCRELSQSDIRTLLKLLRTSDSNFPSRLLAVSRRLPRTMRRVLEPRPYPLSSGELRTAAARALGAVGPGASNAVPELITALEDPERAVCLESAAALGHIGRPAVAALTKRLGHERATVRQAAAYALGEIGPDASVAVPALTELLQDKNEMVRKSAAASLRHIDRISAPGLDLRKPGETEASGAFQDLFC